MPTFYDKFFKPSKTKGIIRSKRTEWSNEEHINEFEEPIKLKDAEDYICLLYTSPSPRDVEESRMPSSA